MISRNQREGWYAGRLPRKLYQVEDKAIRAGHSLHFRQKHSPQDRTYRTAILCWVSIPWIPEPTSE